MQTLETQSDELETQTREKREASTVAPGETTNQ